jgi:hypothetical protein
MKKILCSIFAASLMLLGTSAFAQVAIGAGYVNSKQTLATSSTTVSMPSNGFYAGLDYTVPVGDILGLSAGVNFEWLRSDPSFLLTSLLSGQFTEQYINAPVRVNVGFDLSDGIRIGVFGGPTFSYALSGQISRGSISYDIYKTENYQRFDVLVGGGVNLDLMNKLRVSVGYDLGMFNKYPKIREDHEPAAKLTRNRLHAGVAFLF